MPRAFATRAATARRQSAARVVAELDRLGMPQTDAVTIGERYIRDHELEAARGWDALELLRDLVPHGRGLTARWTPMPSAEQTNARRPS